MKTDEVLFRRSTYLVAFVSGGLLPLAFAPVNIFPLALILPALLFFLLWRAEQQQATAWQVTLLGFCFGLGEFLSGVSWVYVAIHDFGLSSVIIAGLLTLLFVAVLAVFFGLQAFIGHLLISRWRIRQPLRVLLLVYPASWVMMEWCRGWFLTGFPWLNLGYSQVDSPLAGYAPLLGVYGISWLMLIMAGVLTHMVLHRQRRMLQATMLAVVFVVGILLQQIDWTDGQGAPLSVALIQGNLPQQTKWDPEAVQQRVELYGKLTKIQWGKDVIVWPENSMTAYYHQLEPFLAPFGKQAKQAGSELIIGIPYLDQQTHNYYSSFVTLGTTPAPRFYFKSHLVPFGEYLPLDEWLRGLINFFSLPMSSFSRGEWMQPLLEVKGVKVATTICYEDVFGEELIRYLPEASLLVNGSNNAWYGDSWAPHQHLQIARMRALETGRDLLRATTNGISALVDYKGNIMARSMQFETDVVTGTVQPRQGATPYVTWGNYPVLAGLAGVLLVLWLKRRPV